MRWNPQIPGKGWRAAFVLACASLSWNGACAEPPPSDDPSAPADSEDPTVPTLDTVQALPPELEVVDLYRPNPIKVAPNRFDRAWSPSPTVEEVSLQGGYIYLGINYGLYQAGKGLKHLVGGPEHIRHAIARPSPLTEAQLRRAAAHCEDGDCEWRPRHDSNVRPSP